MTSTNLTPDTMNARTTLTRGLASVAVSLALAGCSRDFPSEWNSTSPASGDATAMPHAHVTHALDGDPPLPGEASEGWIGLEQAVETDPHAYHHGHGHAEQPASEPAPEPEPEPAPAAEPEPSEGVTAPTKPTPKSASKPKPKPAPKPEPTPAADDHAHHQHHQPAKHEGHHHGH
ncbi:hypothetical protein [Enhygromyxa salina]|uniref:Uncharacterized protein n=1 Tax=Enhygromyxa salina TaxID=215803 RepID=A0A2S9YFP1_9BACT|nr:hypothetical protein [Enhygromyxa salina]PRQ03915.1 hypothetical protein ENSA7_52060 [Enhygromyxa salina]